MDRVLWACQEHGVKYSYPDDESPTAQSFAVCPECGEELARVVMPEEAAREYADGTRDVTEIVEAVPGEGATEVIEE
jgi:transcription initiation factor IIE alpha subunit